MILNGTPQWVISLKDSWYTSFSGATHYLPVRTTPNRKYKMWTTRCDARHECIGPIWISNSVPISSITGKAQSYPKLDLLSKTERSTSSSALDRIKLVDLKIQREQKLGTSEVPKSTSKKLQLKSYIYIHLRLYWKSEVGSKNTYQDLNLSVQYLCVEAY